MKSIVHEKPIEFPNEQRLIKEEQMKQSQISSIKKNNWVSENSKIENQSVARTNVDSSINAKEIESMLVRPLNLSNEDLLDQARAFEAFRVSSRRYEALQKNADVLKQKMKTGKEIAMTVHQSREKVARLKDRLEQLQRENAVKNLVDGLERDDPE